MKIELYLITSFNYRRDRGEKMPHGFANVHTEVTVRYKFVSKTIPLKGDTVHVGRSKDFSPAGIAVVGKCPDDPLLG